jgi:hypothetical protein
MVRHVMSLGLGILVLAGSAEAQLCTPGEDANEAKLLAFFAAPIAFSPAGLAERLGSGAVHLSFDVTYVPTPSREIRTPDRCYTSNKQENTDLSPIFPRPRLAIGLPGGFYVEGSYLPPITVMDAEPNLGSVALAKVFSMRSTPGGSELNLLLRGHATFGKVRGAITCPSDALHLDDPARPCYGTAQSKDTYKPNMRGGEIALSWRGAGNLAAYVGGGYTSLPLRFQVGFQEGDGDFDSTRVEVDLSRISAFAGARYEIFRGVALTAELYSQPEDVTTFRFGGRYALREGSRD